jgi:hypothetical protein
VGSVANKDGKITIADFEPEDRYLFLGVFTGSINVTATYNDALPIPANGLVVSDLSNPSQPITYLVAVFSKEGCVLAKTITLNPTDCQCPPPKCVPFIITQTKGGQK